MSRTLFVCSAVLSLALVACRGDAVKDDTGSGGGDGDGGADGGADGGSGDGGADGGSSDGGADGGSGDGGSDGGSGDGGTTDACPVVSVSATSLDFSTSALGETAIQTVVVQNDCTGEASLDLTAEITGDDAFTGSAATSLAPGETLSIEVTFAPDSLGDYAASLAVLSNDPDDPSVTVDLTGTFSADADEDGFHDEAAGGTDCDDSNPDAYPKEAEDARDLVDDDCDGLVDEDWIEIGSVWLTEIMLNPVAVGDGLGEWFELYNGSGGAVDLVGWRFTSDDGDSFTVAESVIIDNDDYVVFGVNDDMTANGGAAVHVAYSRDDFSLADSADSIFLYVGSTPVFDVSYGTDWPLQAGASLILDPFYDSSSAISTPDLWCSSSTSFGSGDLGTPGAENDDCTTVDRDEDGYTQDQGDCDDLDPEFSPDVLDIWDGIDNNCDGRIDRVGVDDAASHVRGADGDYLGGDDGLSVADVTGDGTPDLLIGGSYTSETDDYYYQGTVAVIDGSGWDGWGSMWSSLDVASVLGGNGYNQLHRMSQTLGDHNGDGVADLFIAGSDYYSGSTYGFTPAAVIIWGGEDLGGTYEDEYDVTFSGTSTSSYSYVRAASAWDYDGDGIDDVTYSNYYATADRSYYRGLVSVFSGGDIVEGSDYSFEDDSDLYVWGNNSYALLGHSLGGGDLDGDGYDEMFLGAPGYYYDDYTNGSVFVIEGGTGSLGGTGTVGLVAGTRYQGDDGDDFMGYRSAPQVGDFDGDGEMDIAIAAPGASQVYVWFDASSISGEVEASSADVVLTGDGPDWFGLSMTVGDFDDDGMDDLVVGAPDYSSYTYLYYYADEGGVVALFAGADMTGDLSASDASWAAEATGVNGLGWSLANGDFDGDGTPELLTTAPGYGDDQGRLLLYDL